MRRSGLVAALLIGLVATLVPLVMPSPAAATTGKNRWSVGVYKGALRLDYLHGHERWLGRQVETVLEMIPMDSWARIENPAAQLNAWAGTPYDVVFTTPMIPRDGSSTLAAGAGGAYDARWRKFAEAMVAGGRPNARIRLGHEFNHTHYPWSAGGKEDDFAAYYRRIVTVMRSVPGSSFRFTWNVLSGVTTADVERAYPGDAYVDVVSLDLYDGLGRIADREERWEKYRTRAYGLDWLKAFATAHGKPMAFDEWALIKSNDPARRDPAGDSGDDTVFINRMLDFFESERVVYANYFDVSTKFGSTNSRISVGTPYPNASAVYRARVGSVPLTAPLPFTDSPDRPGQQTSAAPGAAISDGRVMTVHGGTPVVLHHGAPPGTVVVAGAATPTAAGTWSVTAAGQVFATGDAPALGSLAGRPNAPVVGLAPTPTGLGYWLLGADGGIFTFGDAAFFGSTGAMRLNQPVVGMSSTPSGRGYWLFAGDGGIFSFGDARFFGSTGAVRLNAPVTTMAPTPDGAGYWLLGADGGVFTFGDAAFQGSTGSDPSVGSIEALVPTGSGKGYWLIGHDARLHAFGDA